MVLNSRPAWAKLSRPYLKNKKMFAKTKRVGSVSQVVEGLPSMCDALNPTQPCETDRNSQQINIPPVPTLVQADTGHRVEG
jgi:hypothetical protein